MSHAAAIFLIILIVILLVLLIAPVGEGESIQSLFHLKKPDEDFEDTDLEQDEFYEEAFSRVIELEVEKDEEEEDISPETMAFLQSVSVPEHGSELSAAEAVMEAPVALFDRKPLPPSKRRKLEEAQSSMDQGTAVDDDSVPVNADMAEGDINISTNVGTAEDGINISTNVGPAGDDTSMPAYSGEALDRINSSTNAGQFGSAGYNGVDQYRNELSDEILYSEESDPYDEGLYAADSEDDSLMILDEDTLDHKRLNNNSTIDARHDRKWPKSDKTQNYKLLDDDTTEFSANDEISRSDLDGALSGSSYVKESYPTSDHSDNNEIIDALFEDRPESSRRPGRKYKWKHHPAMRSDEQAETESSLNSRKEGDFGFVLGTDDKNEQDLGLDTEVSSLYDPNLDETDQVAMRRESEIDPAVDEEQIAQTTAGTSETAWNIESASEAADDYNTDGSIERSKNEPAEYEINRLAGDSAKEETSGAETGADENEGTGLADRSAEEEKTGVAADTGEEEEAGLVDHSVEEGEAGSADHSEAEDAEQSDETPHSKDKEDEMAKDISDALFDYADGVAHEEEARLADLENKKKERQLTDLELETEAEQKSTPQTAENQLNQEPGKKLVIAGRGKSRAVYQISAAGNAVYMSTRMNTGTDIAKIPAEINFANKQYKVNGIARCAFAGRSEIKVLAVEADGLSRFSVAGCLKDSKINRVIVREDKYQLYRHVFTKENTRSGRRLKLKAIR